MLEFSPRGSSKESLQSRQISGNLKAGDAKTIERLIYHIKNLPDKDPIRMMFSDHPVLVPAPRSTPLVEGALWPTKIISDHLVKNGLGGSTQELIQRVEKVAKSSMIRDSALRPSCNTHYNSLRVTPTLEIPTKIIVVDDVFTLGRTTCACVRRLKEVYAEAEIYVFAAMRTRGLIKDIKHVVYPSYKTFNYNSKTDVVSLPD